AVGGTADALAKPKEVTLKELLLAGGWYFIIPMAILSILAFALVIFYFFALRRDRIVSREYVSQAKQLISGGDLTTLEAVSRQTPDVSSRVVAVATRAYLDNAAVSHEVVREIAESEGARQANNLMQLISYLNDIGVIAPMIGLLGTVVGLIRSFSVLSNDVGSARALMLAEGVSQALVNTALGLIIAIPALGFYAFFRGRVQRMVSELESVVTELVGRLAGARTPGV
ncbi:MAG: MotA/TolQ/ExbB proton channel family protein, partial [Verrucomicrobiae bacterium]|nr:MotA/TolQ/ExbB proton channel family protein [Verrucomicrobiae bacterium]